MSKAFWIEFSGYSKIEAETKLEAAQKFWELVHNDTPFKAIRVKDIYAVTE